MLGTQRLGTCLHTFHHGLPNPIAHHGSAISFFLDAGKIKWHLADSEWVKGITIESSSRMIMHGRALEVDNTCNVLHFYLSWNPTYPDHERVLATYPTCASILPRHVCALLDLGSFCLLVPRYVASCTSCRARAMPISSKVITTISPILLKKQ
ncbi:uncharacterized protein EI90DRAFT_1910206 [Cantharellus anzutake]|uniref:uncharacterized protein n=1 Tax=Cantharellus anzutake TaxID=1750568 RepID=UPI001904AED0|nr:uncharacterized protein EI90DRAFT_1910206 [Cantharellus anzutake]KAF8326588.1 hypothetical protein EI90DRAFT_1910206 [Cantharellus anzutake]